MAPHPPHYPPRPKVGQFTRKTISRSVILAFRVCRGFKGNVKYSPPEILRAQFLNVRGKEDF
jgi:hypothetical protein